MTDKALPDCPWRISPEIWSRICDTVEAPSAFMRSYPELIREFEERGAEVEAPAPALP